MVTCRHWFKQHLQSCGIRIVLEFSTGNWRGTGSKTRSSLECNLIHLDFHSKHCLRLSLPHYRRKVILNDGVWYSIFGTPMRRHFHWGCTVGCWWCCSCGWWSFQNLYWATVDYQWPVSKSCSSHFAILSEARVWLVSFFATCQGCIVLLLCLCWAYVWGQFSCLGSPCWERIVEVYFWQRRSWTVRWRLCRCFDKEGSKR